ncbi:MAG: nitroreductase family protein [bacterium]
MNNMINALNRHYATKRFDTNKKLSQDNVNILLEAARLSPSSFGLQPWRGIHVINPETRKQLQEHSRGQTQITEASDLLVIAVKTNLQASDVEEYIQSMKEIRSQDLDKLPEDAKSIEKLMEYKNMMIGTIESKTQEQIKGWNQKQAYIVL